MPTMPNCIGLKYEAALAAMVVAGVRVLPLGYFQVDPVKIGWLKSNAARPGFVVQQSPLSGQTIAANAAVLLTVSSFSMAVSGDGPVQQPQIPGDAILDGPNSPFILDESKLK